ncbi:MAG: cytochrome b/b6 domain-containing protein, partial [Candidatus Latescibacterota bacterium]
AATPDGFDVVPHKIKHSATLTCADCHGSKIARIEAQFERSVHASAGDGSFRCVYCHDPHAPPPFELNLSVRDHVEFTNGICINCHANAARYRAVTGRDDLPPSLYESHAWLPRAGTHARIVLCVCCHTPVDHEGSHEILPKSRAQRKCESCHHQNSPVARKFLGEPDRTTWITHEVWFGDAYVKGAMRHRLVDGILLALAAFVILAALGHGVLLWISRRRRDSLPFVVESSPVYDGWVRSWHWGNAALFIVLLVTGFRIHFGGREEPLLSFETAFYTHNLAGAALVLWFVWFLVIGYLTGNAGSYWKAPRPWIAGMFRQARYYLYGIFKGEPHPFHPDRKRRFNPLQQLIYLAVMYLFFPILVITGVVLLYPEWLPETIAGEKAGWVIATAHYLVGWALTLFLIVHIYLCTLGDRFSYNFRGMVDGLHRSHRVIEPEEDAPAEDAVEPPESSPEDKEPSPPPSPE